jgi:hypothetical protein
LAKKNKFSDMKEMKEFLEYIGYANLGYLNPELTSYKVRRELIKMMVNEESLEFNDFKSYYTELMEEYHPKDKPDFNTNNYLAPGLLEDAFKHFKEKR